jgi:phospholipid transport system substrate-binding protein
LSTRPASEAALSARQAAGRVGRRGGRRAVLLLPLILFAGPGARAQAKNAGLANPGLAPTASAFIEAAGRELGAIMREAGGEAARRQRMREFVGRVVDVPRVGQFCLGRFWRVAGAAERQAYLRLFQEFLAAVVMQRAGAYGTAQSRITLQPEQPGEDGVRVPTVVADGSAAPVGVTWVVAAGGAADFRIIDVLAEGISLRQTKRAEFTSFLAAHDGDFAAFLAALRAHLP